MYCDVKLENILVSVDDFVYFVDFGIVSVIIDEKLIQFGNMVGIFYYMVLEWFSELYVIYCVDIYVLICVLYECLIGLLLYQGDQFSVMGVYINQVILWFSMVWLGILVVFDVVIVCGMVKNLEDCYVICGDLLVVVYVVLVIVDQDCVIDILWCSQVVKLLVLLIYLVLLGIWWLQLMLWVGGVLLWGLLLFLLFWLVCQFWLWVGVVVVVVVVLVGGLGIVFVYLWWLFGFCMLVLLLLLFVDVVEFCVFNDGVFVGSLVVLIMIDIFNEFICLFCGSFIRLYVSDIDIVVVDKQLVVCYYLFNFFDDQLYSKNYLM